MHKKLDLGTILQMNVSNLNMAAGGAVVPGLPAEFMRFPGSVHHLGQPVAGTGTNPDYQPVQQGPSTIEPDRTFLWLPYVPGLITLVPFDRSKAICTGWMSGCWLVQCTLNGVAHFAHIGTVNSAHDPATVKVKNAFKLAIGTGKLKVVSAFQPICRIAEETMGVLSMTGEYFAIGISKVASSLPKAQPVQKKAASIQISGPVGGSITNLQVVEKSQKAGQPSLPYGF